MLLFFDFRVLFVMLKYLSIYFLTLITFLIIDLLWIGFFAKNLYKANLGSYLLENPKWVPAFIFYSLYVFSVFIFCIKPALENNSLNQALLLGAFFGFICYATYDLTNYATLKDWPLKVVIVDILWGTVLTLITALVGYKIAKMFL